MKIKLTGMFLLLFPLGFDAEICYLFYHNSPLTLLIFNKIQRLSFDQKIKIHLTGVATKPWLRFEFNQTWNLDSTVSIDILVTVT